MEAASTEWLLESALGSEVTLADRAEEPLQPWGVQPDCQTLSDSESEGSLHGVDPNKVFIGVRHDSVSSHSDSGISEEPVVMGTVTTTTSAATLPVQPAVYQLVYDVSAVGGATSGAGLEDVIAIELDEWSGDLLLSDSCVVNELPSSSSAASSEDQRHTELQLTEEEQKLLSQEGVALPANLPLTKAEERVLKKVRRKIRNKQSAQDSRRRRKEYIDGLESRATTCCAQNKELRKTVEKLERHNMSLLSQLNKLQAVISRSVSKGAQTTTCLLIVAVSLSLIILPSFSPFRRLKRDDEYTPTGVISRNILTNPAAAASPSPDDVIVLAAQTDTQSQFPETVQSEALEEAWRLQEPIESSDNSTVAGTEQEESQSGDGSAAVAIAPQRHSDAAKPAHADEM